MRARSLQLLQHTTPSYTQTLATTVFLTASSLPLSTGRHHKRGGFSALETWRSHHGQGARASSWPVSSRRVGHVRCNTGTSHHTVMGQFTDTVPASHTKCPQHLAEAMTNPAAGALSSLLLYIFTEEITNPIFSTVSSNILSTSLMPAQMLVWTLGR